MTDKEIDRKNRELADLLFSFSRGELGDDAEWPSRGPRWTPIKKPSGNGKLNNVEL